MFKDIFYSLTEDEQEMFIKLLGMATETRKEYSKDYPDGGYFSSKTRPSKPEKTQTQIEKPNKITDDIKVQFLRASELLKQEKIMREKRERYLKEEMVKKHKYLSTADYYESDILDSYAESKVCDEW
jgi:hypothetical protein